jgi:hypothetical protein
MENGGQVDLTNNPAKGKRKKKKKKQLQQQRENQKGKCGIKHPGVLWVGTPIDEAKVDLSVLRPLPLVRLLKYATHHPHLSLLPAPLILSPRIFIFGAPRLPVSPCDLNLVVSTGPGAPGTRASGCARASVRAPVKRTSRQLCSDLFPD